ncbi:SIMPL domain-containing protein [Aquihabitans sp. McL0605]|uniref:SIMPL domain-containing protein n=1 Tax=Aquihabitans sp. McL0605 TaxID=3415671 RepID=UPI003CF7499E
MPAPRPRLSRAALATLAAAAMVLLASCSQGADAERAAPAAAPRATNRTVTVNATGTSKGVPDSMLVSVSIVSGGPSAAEVLTDNSQRTQRVLDQLKFTGVDDKDVSTTSVDLGPTYDKKGNIDGYAATNSLRIAFRDLKTAGAKLDLLVQSGDNRVRVGSVQLGFNEDDELVSSARIDAVKRARAQADEMAKAAGAEIGRVRTIADVVPQGQAAWDGYATSAKLSAADQSVPISAGSQELNVEVKVVFELS